MFLKPGYIPSTYIKCSFENSKSCENSCHITELILEFNPNSGILMTFNDQKKDPFCCEQVGSKSENSVKLPDLLTVNQYCRVELLWIPGYGIHFDDLGIFFKYLGYNIHLLNFALSLHLWEIFFFWKNIWDALYM